MDKDLWEVGLDEYDFTLVYDRGHWRTRDNVRLDIREMETSHIKNTINLLKRNLEKLD